ncbi:Hypothetical_protein [Hexamita inflata]|uniref:Hypothetical_protein n=1 Tax=Hexamita inflata TaxID=28002 RepID=A0ABP1HG50_9EUKA
MVDLFCYSPNSPEYQIDHIQSEIYRIKQPNKSNIIQISNQNVETGEYLVPVKTQRQKWYQNDVKIQNLKSNSKNQHEHQNEENEEEYESKEKSPSLEILISSSDEK